MLTTKKFMTNFIAKDKANKKAIKILAKNCIKKIKDIINKEDQRFKAKNDGHDITIHVDTKYYISYTHDDCEYGNFVHKSFYALPKRTDETSGLWTLDILTAAVHQFDTDPNTTHSATTTVVSEDDIDEDFVMEEWSKYKEDDNE